VIGSCWQEYPTPQEMKQEELCCWLHVNACAYVVGPPYSVALIGWDGLMGGRIFVHSSFFPQNCKAV